MSIRSKEIGLVISSKIAYHTALPYIKELHSKNINIVYLVSDDVIEEITAGKKKNEVIFLIEDYKSKNKLALNLHRLFLLIYTPINFSSLYQRWINQRLSNRSFIFKKVVLALINFFPKLEIKKINSKLQKTISRFIKHRLNVEKIINITITTVPFLLADDTKKVYSILESWDHPGKSPMGYKSKKVFLWNTSIKEEWLKYQGEEDIYFSFPIKLAYAINNENRKTCLVNKNTLMYPFTTSSGSDALLYKEELEFVHIVCRVLFDLSYELYIKPKPNTPIGELDFFKQYENVKICSYQNNNGGSSYDLGEEYNQNRLKELSKCNYIITRGTTFAFDTAAYGLPVIQFMFSVPSEFPALSNLKNYPHISKHIISNKELVFELQTGLSIEKQLFNIFISPDTFVKAEKFRDYLRNWLIPNETMEESVSRVIDEILKDD